MITPSESLDHPGAALVPPRVDRARHRARRISRLLPSGPVLTVVFTWFSVDKANNVFGFWPDSSAIPLGVALCGAALATLLRSAPAAPSLGGVQFRAPRRGVLSTLVVLVPMVLAAGFLMLQPSVLSMGRTVVLLMLTIGWMAFDWWQKRWWARLVLVMVYGSVSALLPLWLPAADRGLPVIQLIWFSYAALSTVVDQCELRMLLREADREADAFDEQGKVDA